MTLHIQEPAVIAFANKATGAGVFGTILGWAESSTFGMWAGIFIGLLGVGINLYYKRKSDKRAIEAHNHYMSKPVNPVAPPPPPAEKLPPVEVLDEFEVTK